MLFRLLLGWDRMQSYTVHEQIPPPLDRVDRADALMFVKDGFSLQAALFAPLWLAGKGLWLALLGYIAIMAALIGLWVMFGWSMAGFMLAWIAVHLIVGFESDSALRMHLASKGWHTLGAVTGKDALDCERRFFDVWLPGEPLSQTVAPPVTGRITAPPKPAGGFLKSAASLLSRR
jgi:hypothetical protein